MTASQQMRKVEMQLRMVNNGKPFSNMASCKLNILKAFDDTELGGFG